MKVNEIKIKAKDFGIKINKNMKKNDLIWAIQTAEGNYKCFGTAQHYCDQEVCAWRKDCLPGMN
jgi:hypothetical protein